MSREQKRFTLHSYATALLTLAGGIFLSIELHDWSWFARSGSLLVVNGIILTSHHIFQHIHNLNDNQRQRGAQFVRDWGKSERHHLIHDDKEHTWRNEQSGLFMLIAGTIIWGFGDLLNYM